MFDPSIFTESPDFNAASLEAAKYIFSRVHPALSEGKQFVLGMATGNSPIKLYEELLTLFRGADLDLSQFYTVNLDEYYPIPQAHEQSYHTYMMQHFWGPLQQISGTFNPQTQALIPNGEAKDSTAECAAYEDKIKALGGIDLQILGIGTNGHIGFNEPGSDPDSRTRVVQLAEQTIQDNSMHFAGDATAVPREAITMGIATIMEAKELVIIASGQSKAPIIRALKDAKEPQKDIPATYLMDHPAVHFFVDAAANAA